MRNTLKLNRLIVSSGIWASAKITAVSTKCTRPVYLEISHNQRLIHRQGPRCFSCLCFHSTCPTASPLTAPLFSSLSRDAKLPLSFSRYDAFHRSFRSSTEDRRSSANAKSEAATAFEGESKESREEKEGSTATEDCEKSEETRLRLKEDEEKDSSVLPKRPPEGEIGFIEGRIDQIRILDAKEKKTAASPTKDGRSSSAIMAGKREKKKSSDLRALEKFDIIVSGEERGKELTLEKESPRTFQLTEDDRSILQPAEEPMALRKKPEVHQDDRLDPRRKGGWKIGDRKKPPEFNFSLRHALFEEAAALEGGKTKRAFEMAIQMFCKVDPKYRRGHVEMIYKAANLLDEYGLEKDLDAYKMIFDLFPKGILIPKGVFQAGFYHYPRQQDCAVEVMCKMELNRVMPDNEIGQQIKEIFGRRSNPHRKFRRMTYWMPKFRYASPFPQVPMDIEKEDALTAAKRLLERICVDLENEITIHRVPRPAEEDPFSVEALPWIASAISPKQRELISRLPTEKAIFVKGPFPVYLRGRKVEHFTLWAELPDPLKEHYEGEEELFEDYMRQGKDMDELMDSDIARQAFRGKKRKNVLAHRPSLHEQEDGIILALSVLESFSKEILTSWIKFLETSNPHLSNVPVIFSLNSPPPSDLVVQVEDTDTVVVNH